MTISSQNMDFLKQRERAGAVLWGMGHLAGYGGGLRGPEPEAQQKGRTWRDNAGRWGLDTGGHREDGGVGKRVGLEEGCTGHTGHKGVFLT